MKPTENESEKEVRIQLRTTQEEKAYLEYAASRCGFKHLSEFLRVSLYEKVRKEFPDLAPTYHRNLSAQDSHLFAENLLNPPKANKKLKALFAED